MFRTGTILFVLLFSIVSTTAFAAPIAQMEEEGNPWWLWLIVFAVLALFVGFMLWWWLREPEEEAETTVTHHTRAAVYDSPAIPEAAVDKGQVVAAYTVPQDTEELAAAPAEPAEPPAPDVTEPNDLTVIEGIGPVIQTALYAAGIKTYNDLAAADPTNIEAILQESDARLARLSDPSTWPQQARLAALDQWDELDTLKEQLTAGRRA